MVLILINFVLIDENEDNTWVIVRFSCCLLLVIIDVVALKYFFKMARSFIKIMCLFGQLNHFKAQIGSLCVLFFLMIGIVDPIILPVIDLIVFYQPQLMDALGIKWSFLIARYLRQFLPFVVVSYLTMILFHFLQGDPDDEQQQDEKDTINQMENMAENSSLFKDMGQLKGSIHSKRTGTNGGTGMYAAFGIDTDYNYNNKNYQPNTKLSESGDTNTSHEDLVKSREFRQQTLFRREARPSYKSTRMVLENAIERRNLLLADNSTTQGDLDLER